MNKKSFIFFAAIALVLVGCNKEKEETIGTTASIEQQQQALPNVSNNAAPAATVTTATNIPVAVPATPEQATTSTVGQQQVVPQPPQGEVSVGGLQSQFQPVQPMPVAPITDQQNMPGNLPTMQAPVTPEPATPISPMIGNSEVPMATPPVMQSDVAPGPVMPASPVVTNNPTSTQNVVVPASPYGTPKVKPGIRQDVVSNAQLAAPAPSTLENANLTNTGTVGQSTDVVSTKVSYRNVITTSKDSGQDTAKGNNSSGSSNSPTTTTPADED